MTSLSGETRFSRVGLVLETARRVRCRQELCEAVTTFQILRVDTNEVIQDCVVGYERAKKMTAYLRREFDLDHDVYLLGRWHKIGKSTGIKWKAFQRQR